MRFGPITFGLDLNRAGLVQLHFEVDIVDRFAGGATLGVLCRRPNTGYEFCIERRRRSLHIEVGPLFFFDAYREGDPHG